MVIAGIVLLLTVTINTLVLDYLFADSVSSERDRGLLILSLLFLAHLTEFGTEKARITLTACSYG